VFLPLQLQAKDNLRPCITNSLICKYT